LHFKAITLATAFLAFFALSFFLTTFAFFLATFAFALAFLAVFFETFPFLANFLIFLAFTTFF
jgi:hypothetical protein